MNLSLSDFKRPKQDNGRGLHGSASVGWDGGEKGLDFWIGELQALGCKWFKVLDDCGDSIPLCSKLVAAGIFPVVRIMRRDPPPNDGIEPNPGHLNTAEEGTLKKLIDIGVLYFETNNEPNLATEWKNAAIPGNVDEAAKLVALNWLFDARLILDAGGYPSLPAISGGKEMDIIGSLYALGRQDILLEGCWIAIHNYCLNRPLNYPGDQVTIDGAAMLPEEYECGAMTTWMWWDHAKGGPDLLDEVNRLRADRKNRAQSVADDHSCFREFEYYDALARQYVGRSIPILGTECGYLVGRREDSRYARVTPELHADMTTALFDFMQREAPDYYFASMPWIMLPSSGWQAEAWYSDFWPRAFRSGMEATGVFPPLAQTGGGPEDCLPVVKAVKGMPNVPRLLRSKVEPRTGASLVKPPPPPPPMAKENMYLVQYGDTLNVIARKFGTSVTALAGANHIADPSRIIPGQRLIIPPPSAIPLPPAPPRRQKTGEETPSSRTTKPSPPLPKVPSASGTADFDPRLGALGVRVLNALVPRGDYYWRLVKAEYLDPSRSLGDHHIYYYLIDENGTPVSSQRVCQGRPDDQAVTFTDTDGRANIAMWESFSPQKGEPGAYSAWIDGLPSDRVTGLGLPEDSKVSFRLTWQRARN